MNIGATTFDYTGLHDQVREAGTQLPYNVNGATKDVQCTTGTTCQADIPLRPLKSESKHSPSPLDWGCAPQGLPHPTVLDLFLIPFVYVSCLTSKAFLVYILCITNISFLSGYPTKWVGTSKDGPSILTS